MIKNRNKFKILVYLILIGFLFNTLLISLNSTQVFYQKYNKYENEEYVPEIAQALAYSDIDQNASHVYRWFDSINFTVYTSKFPDANYTIMQISFYNGSVEYYNMVSVGNNESFYEYKPRYNAPQGMHNVSFLIYDEFGILLNDHTTYTNFTIHANCFASFNSFEYFIGDTLDAELTVINYSTYQFKWDITVVDSMNEGTQKNLLNLESNLNHFTLPIDNETFRQVNKRYFLKINMSEISNTKKAAAYFPLNVRNSNPRITSNINLTPAEVFRTDECTVSLNATDIETAAENLTITMYVQDSEGEDVLEDVIEHKSGNSFSDKFNIPLNHPIGKYRINATVRDEDGGLSSKVTFLVVKNNAPEIHSYTINGKSMNESISILYGRNLIFSFNVSDVEGVAYVQVALLDENNEWYNITRAYKGEDTQINIRTIELISGTWFVYIYVIDSDGAVTSLIDDYNMAPQVIRIIPDVLSNYLPWIIFFFGLIIGILGGVGIIYRYFKSKYVESQPIPPKKKEIRPKKSIAKKKGKPEPIKKELEEKEIEELKPEKEEEKEEVPKRKIRRKL